jgi:hypothetical protein
VDANGHPQQLDRDCYEAAFVWCMSDFAKLDVGKPVDHDRRRA